MGADNEWAFYGRDMVTWLLRSMGDREYSWIATDVSFAVPKRTWK